MVAASPSSERARELSELRRRAYGPASDIDRDEAALARLRELEDLARRERTPAEGRSGARAEQTPSTVGGEADAAASPEPATAAPQARPTAAMVESAPAAADAPVADETPTPAAAATGRRGLLRRIPPWILIIVCLVIGAVFGAVGAASTVTAGPQPDAVLEIATSTDQGGTAWVNRLSSWGFDPSSAVPFDDYRGMGVWSARSDQGAPCILLSNGGDLLTAACAVAGLEPIVDWVVGDGYPPNVLDEPLPNNTWVRFILRGSTVEVWTVIPGGATSQAFDTSLSVSAAKVP